MLLTENSLLLGESSLIPFFIIFNLRSKQPWPRVYYLPSQPPSPPGLNSVASGVVALRRASQTVPEFGEHFLKIGASAADEALYPKLSPGEYVEEPAVFQVCPALAGL